MAGSFVTPFQWRLNSMLLQEKEILFGVKDQIESLICKLDKVGSFAGDAGRILIRERRYQSWTSELKGTLREAEDYFDDFMIKVYEQTGQDQKQTIAEFGNELVGINSRFSDIINGRPQLEASPMLERIQKLMRSKQHFDESKEKAMASCMSNYINLPHNLKWCFLYCCAFMKGYEKTKDALVEVLVASGLIQEKPEVLMEDTAMENIEKLVDLGMLEEDDNWRESLEVPLPYRELYVGMMDAEEFFISTEKSDVSIPPTARHVSIHVAEKSIPNMNALLLHSLFVLGNQAGLDGLETVLYNLKHVRVLDLEQTHLESLPDELGKLVHLRYLGLRNSKLNELPESICNLRNLQTLDIYFSAQNFELPKGVLNLVQLRHLKMFQPSNDREVRVPQGISRLTNLQTLQGIYAGDGITEELGNMTQLRSLHVRRVSDDHAEELYASIANLTGLRDLSMTVEEVHFSEKTSPYEGCLFPSLESFSPPPLLETLELVGHVTEMPIWLESMENLTSLSLYWSHLSENPTTILQFLPNLKSLTMWHAYKGKRMERDFFRAGGFAKLEYLRIISRALLEWTEIEEGAFPSLKHLCFWSCPNLLGVPQGLQHVSTLKKLILFGVHGDLTRRLGPTGPENYKIKHIPFVKYFVRTSSWGFWSFGNDLSQKLVHI